MNQMVLVFAAGILFGGCSSSPWNQEQFPLKVMLREVSPEQGGHCESSALLNALNYQGYNFTEAEIVGISGAMGFLYEMGAFPFLGGRSLTLKEDFFSSAGIVWHQGGSASPENAWMDVVSVLQDNNPVILHVDMRYLPYLWGGKYGSRYTSFGWHIITLFGIDFEKEEAYVSDTALKGIQTISLKDLDKARSSKTDLLAPEYKWYWAEKAPEGYSPDWEKMKEDALARILRHYEAEVIPGTEPESIGGIRGLEVFSDKIVAIETYVKPYLLQPVFNSLYGWIEEYGTGGASFRIFTRDFLISAYEKTSDPSFPEAISLLSEAIDDWHNLSAEFKAVGNIIKDVKDREERKTLYLQVAEKADTLYNSERSFYLYVKEISR